MNSSQLAKCGAHLALYCTADGLFLDVFFHKWGSVGSVGFYGITIWWLNRVTDQTGCWCGRFRQAHPWTWLLSFPSWFLLFLYSWFLICQVYVYSLTITMFKSHMLMMAYWCVAGGILDWVDTYIFTGALVYSFVKIGLPLFGVW